MTHVSRRGLLKAGALTVMLAPLIVAPTTNLYSRSRFSPLLGQTFGVSDAVGKASMTLARISDLKGAVPDDDDAFTLTFRSARGEFGQGTYNLSRPGFANTEMFLVPADASRSIYQAIINRSVKVAV